MIKKNIQKNISKDSILIIFTRYPIVGYTKTRLINAIGAKKAAQIQRDMTEFTIAQAYKTSASVQIHFTGGSHAQMQHWLGSEHDMIEQSEGDLGARLCHAFSNAFGQGAKRVVIIGSDCPDNRSSNIEKCFHKLAQSPCVIGPATDGGYYMMGLRYHQPELFQNIRWGTSDVKRQTIKAAKTYKLMPVLNDIDEPQDILPRISVIIPALNESENITRCIKSVNTGFNVECLVVDGGSTDDTIPLAINAGAQVITLPKAGRAHQMNWAAKQAIGDIFLFLHADCELPDAWDCEVRLVMKQPEVALGYFPFKIKDHFLGRRLIEIGTNIRARVLMRPYGDQGLFMRQHTFATINGYPEVPILEDIIFVKTSKTQGRLQCTHQPLLSSGRRWQQWGAYKTTFVNLSILIAAAMGKDLHTLSLAYSKGKSPLASIFRKPHNNKKGKDLCQKSKSAL